MLEIIAERLRQPEPMPRHLLQTLSRLGHNDRRCARYYSSYGFSSSASSYDVPPEVADASGAGGGGGGADGEGEVVVVATERRPEWDKVYMHPTRGSIRVGFQSVSACCSCEALCTAANGRPEVARNALTACAVDGAF